jgi:hypothetical protein
MSKRYIVGAVLAVMLSLGCLLVRQNAVAATALPGEGSQWVISTTREATLLLDTKTGKSWMLERSLAGDCAWLPVKRIDNEQDAARWRGGHPKRDSSLTGLLKSNPDSSE